MNNIKKIDIHAHAIAFDKYVPPVAPGVRFISVTELIEIYDKLNIEKGLLLPIVSPEGFPNPITTEETKFLVDKHPDRFVWFCGVDPRAVENTPNSNLKHLINHYKSLGARGVGEITANLYADDPKVDNLFSCCEESDMPVTIHISTSFEAGYYGLVDELGLPRIEKMLKCHPKLKVLGHSQPFWAELSSDITEETRGGYPTGKVTDGRISELMRKYENLYCDLSAESGAFAMMRDREFTARFFEEFSDRILFGCDLCFKHATHQYKFDEFLDEMVRDGFLSLENYKKIVRENAIKLLKLDETI